MSVCNHGLPFLNLPKLTHNLHVSLPMLRDLNSLRFGGAWLFIYKFVLFLRSAIPHFFFRTELGLSWHWLARTEGLSPTRQTRHVSLPGLCSKSGRKKGIMGKGRGCMPSKHKPPAGAATASPPLSPKATPADEAQAREPSTENINLSTDGPPGVDSASNKLKLFIVYYSMYGHVEALARKIKEGVDSVDGVEGQLFRVAETLTPDVLEKMKAPPKDELIPIISAHELPAADGVIFGFPTRYGAMAAQMKAFFDSTGSLWRKQELAGKAAGLFVSTGTQGGGQETTAWTAVTQLAHHGMLFVPVGYTFGAGMFKLDEIRGGSPYGAGTYAGDGTRLPTETELSLAEHQGKYTAGIVQRLLRN